MSSESEEEDINIDPLKAKHKYQNKIHARLARGKRRQVEELLEARVQCLLSQGDEMRRMVDEKYMETLRANNQIAGSGAVFLDVDGSGKILPVFLSEKLCSNCYKDEYIRQSEIMKMEVSEDKSLSALPVLPEKVSGGGTGDTKESYLARRERNRIHAKRTRFRRKRRAELNKYLCREMEVENKILRSYLFSIGVLSKAQMDIYEAELSVFKEKLALIDRPTSYIDIEVPTGAATAVTAGAAGAGVESESGEQHTLVDGRARVLSNAGGADDDVNDFANLLMNFTKQQGRPPVSSNGSSSSRTGSEEGAGHADRGMSPLTSDDESRDDTGFPGSTEGSLSPRRRAASVGASPNGKEEVEDSAAASVSARSPSGADTGVVEAQDGQGNGGRKKNKSYKKLRPYNYSSVRAPPTTANMAVGRPGVMGPAVMPQLLHMPMFNASQPPQMMMDHSHRLFAHPAWYGAMPSAPVARAGMEVASMPSLIYYGLFPNSPLVKPEYESALAAPVPTGAVAAATAGTAIPFAHSFNPAVRQGCGFSGVGASAGAGAGAGVMRRESGDPFSAFQTYHPPRPPPPSDAGAP